MFVASCSRQFMSCSKKLQLCFCSSAFYLFIYLYFFLEKVKTRLSFTMLAAFTDLWKITTSVRTVATRSTFLTRSSVSPGKSAAWHFWRRRQQQWRLAKVRALTVINFKRNKVEKGTLSIAYSKVPAALIQGLFPSRSVYQQTHTHPRIHTHTHTGTYIEQGIFSACE